MSSLRDQLHDMHDQYLAERDRRLALEAKLVEIARITERGLMISWHKPALLEIEKVVRS